MKEQPNSFVLQYFCCDPDASDLAEGGGAMREQQQHTETPWYVHESGAIFSESGKCVAYLSEMEAKTTEAEREANAHFIVTACNSFEQQQTLINQMREAIQEFCDYYSGNKAVMLGNGQAAKSLVKFRAALQAAEGEEGK